MKILWLEVSVPASYRLDNRVVLGWQDSLESIVKKITDVQLFVGFEGSSLDVERKIVDGVTYIPFQTQLSKLDRFRKKWNWDKYAEQMKKSILPIVESCQPDLIHVFGTEWPLALIAEVVKVPVVVHIQGAIIPYNNAMFPPGYVKKDLLRVIKNPKQFFWNLCFYKQLLSRERIEQRIWKNVRYYMGRTLWDESLSFVMHNNRKYFHVEEAIRPVFLQETLVPHRNFSKIKLVTTGCSSFWKGPDMLLKTARILRLMNVDFEWTVVGNMSPWIKKCVERKVGESFGNCNITIKGFTPADELKRFLDSSSMYVHTAYIENSPNAICEAQCAGLPVIATNVGGVASLVSDGVDGVLVPANDPWQMAAAIVRTHGNDSIMKRFSENAQKKALQRHAPEHIAAELLDCYKSIINENQ